MSEVLYLIFVVFWVREQSDKFVPQQFSSVDIEHRPVHESLETSEGTDEFHRTDHPGDGIQQLLLDVETWNVERVSADIHHPTRQFLEVWVQSGKPTLLFEIHSRQLDAVGAESRLGVDEVVHPDVLDDRLVPAAGYTILVGCDTHQDVLLLVDQSVEVVLCEGEIPFKPLIAIIFAGSRTPQEREDQG